MKTALYIENGVSQVVLTPESDFERDVLRRFLPGRHDEPWIAYNRPAPVVATIMRGSFYETRGGWTRYNDTADDSLILRIVPETQEPALSPIGETISSEPVSEGSPPTP